MGNPSYAQGYRSLIVGFGLVLLAYPNGLWADVECAGDPTRTVFAGGRGTGEDGGACRQFNGNQALCDQAFHIGDSGIASCFYDNGECSGCGPNNANDGDCTNTCRVPTCADPTRTLFVDSPETGEDGGACHTYDGDQTNCEKAFHQSSEGGGFWSCFYDNGECRGCGPRNVDENNCTNTCIGSPVCSEDPGRTIFAGGPRSDACHEFDDDPDMCNEAFHLGGDGEYSSCFPTTECVRCGGSGRDDTSPGGTAAGVVNTGCINDCQPTCADSSRTVYLGGGGNSACHVYDGNQAACEAAYHSSHKGTATCFYDNGLCKGCGPDNEGSSSCTNTCIPASCSGRTTFARGSQACRQFDGDQTSCEAAFHRTNAGKIASCFYDSGNCEGCGPKHKAEGACTDACDATALCADASRTIYTGSQSDACHQFDNDATSCNKAFHITGSGHPASCFYNATDNECRGCGPNNLSDGFCTNSCEAAPTCSTSTRTLGSCENFDSNPTVCNTKFELGSDGPVSCVSVPVCNGCGVYNQANDVCSNTCTEGPAPAGEAGNCNDRRDNDGDTLIDCLDPDCAGDPACAAPAPTLSWGGTFAALLLLGGVALYRLRGSHR